jgi:hypothetical protein
VTIGRNSIFDSGEMANSVGAVPLGSLTATSSLTATATDPAGNTSEMSSNVAITVL